MSEFTMQTLRGLGIQDPTGKSDEEFLDVIQTIHGKVLDLAKRVEEEKL